MQEEYGCLWRSEEGVWSPEVRVVGSHLMWATGKRTPSSPRAASTELAHPQTLSFKSHPLMAPDSIQGSLMQHPPSLPQAIKLIMTFSSVDSTLSLWQVLCVFNFLIYLFSSLSEIQLHSRALPLSLTNLPFISHNIMKKS